MGDNDLHWAVDSSFPALSLARHTPGRSVGYVASVPAESPRTARQGRLCQLSPVQGDSAVLGPDKASVCDPS